MGAIDDLSPRERQCLSLLARPMRPKEIAAELTLSVKTVEGYLAAAKAKLGASSALHAARLYDDHTRAAAPGKPLEEIPRVEVLPNPPLVDPGSIATVAVPQGREITLAWWKRAAIIPLLTFAMILSVLVIVAGAEGITRLERAYYAGHPINRQ